MQLQEDTIEFWPVAEAYVSGSASWPLWTDPGFSYIRLDDATRLDQVGTVVLKLLGAPEPNLSVAAAVDRIVSVAAPMLAGGIEVVVPGGCVVRPGCCSGIEYRHDWRAFLETGESPWTGHDPSPRLERDGGRVRIWSDDTDDKCLIELSVERFIRGLDEVERRLCGFARRLSVWSPSEGECLERWFLDAFRVAPHATARSTA